MRWTRCFVRSGVEEWKWSLSSMSRRSLTGSLLTSSWPLRLNGRLRLIMSAATPDSSREGKRVEYFWGFPKIVFCWSKGRVDLNRIFYRFRWNRFAFLRRWLCRFRRDNLFSECQWVENAENDKGVGALPKMKLLSIKRKSPVTSPPSFRPAAPIPMRHGVDLLFMFVSILNSIIALAAAETKGTDKEENQLFHPV